MEAEVNKPWMVSETSGVGEAKKLTATMTMHQQQKLTISWNLIQKWKMEVNVAAQVEKLMMENWNDDDWKASEMGVARLKMQWKALMMGEEIPKKK